MPKDYPRSRRVAEQIQRELAQLIRETVKDPRLGFVSVTDVEVTRDIAYANVYVSALGEDSAANQSAEVLNGAAGFLRGELGRRMRLRMVPALRFHADNSIAEGMRMSQIIDKAIAGNTGAAGDAESDEAGKDNDTGNDTGDGVGQPS